MKKGIKEVGNKCDIPDGGNSVDSGSCRSNKWQMCHRRIKCSAGLWQRESEGLLGRWTEMRVRS